MKNLRFAVKVNVIAFLLMGLIALLVPNLVPSAMTENIKVASVVGLFLTIITMYVTLYFTIKNIDRTKTNQEMLAQGLISTWKLYLLVDLCLALISFAAINNLEYIVVRSLLFVIGTGAIYVLCQYFIKQLSKSEHLNVPKVN